MQYTVGTLWSNLNTPKGTSVCLVTYIKNKTGLKAHILNKKPPLSIFTRLSCFFMWSCLWKNMCNEPLVKLPNNITHWAEQTRNWKQHTSTCGKWERWERSWERGRRGPDRQTPSLVVTGTVRGGKQTAERKHLLMQDNYRHNHSATVFYQSSKQSGRIKHTQPMNLSCWSW